MKTLQAKNHEARELRKKSSAEVFTPPKLVNQMLSKLPREVWKKGKTFCDPACGNGNFLIAVLWRKIHKGHKPIDALKSIYGVDIMRDNVCECRMRLLKVISLFEAVREEHIAAVFQNVVWVNLKRFPEGSLQYDFSFRNKVKKEDVERWMENIHKAGALEGIELPVNEEISNPVGSEPQIDFEDEYISSHA